MRTQTPPQSITAHSETFKDQFTKQLLNNVNSEEKSCNIVLSFNLIAHYHSLENLRLKHKYKTVLSHLDRDF